MEILIVALVILIVLGAIGWVIEDIWGDG